MEVIEILMWIVEMIMLPLLVYIIKMLIFNRKERQRVEQERHNKTRQHDLILKDIMKAILDRNGIKDETHKELERWIERII